MGRPVNGNIGNPNTGSLNTRSSSTRNGGAQNGIISSFRDVTKEYTTGEVVVQALRGVTFDVYQGEILVILGPSGSGKSTLLNILGGLDIPTSGAITFRNAEVTRFNESELTRYRRYSVGFIFQSYNLLPDLTAKENVDLARDLVDDPLDSLEVLRRVGLADRADHFPSQLSGGEQQRVAIARGVAKNPELLLCDEPTGALDFETGRQVLKLLKDINTEFRRTIVLITHNAPLAAMGNRVLRMRSGKITDIQHNATPADPERIDW